MNFSIQKLEAKKKKAKQNKEKNYIILQIFWV